MNLRFLRRAVLLAAIVLLAFGIGYRFAILSSQMPKASALNSGLVSNSQSGVDLSLFWDVWNRVSQAYIDKKAVNPQKMLYGAISGMVASLDDPYTVFLPPQDNKEMKDELGGQFEGIGAQLGIKDKRIVVIAPLNGTPAETSGIKAGDWIIKVDGQSTGNWTLPQAVSKIRGAKNSTVTLNILHEGDEKPIDIKITRNTIHVASVELAQKNFRCSTQTIQPNPTDKPASSACLVIKESCPDCVNIPIIKLSRFGDNTKEEWDTVIDKVTTLACGKKNPDCRGVILDLRNNPGGYLQGAVYIASEFIPKGVVVSQKSSSGQVQDYTVDHKGRLTTVPLVVLINKGSASASEIVAGAIKVTHRAKLVGETSFGKGSVQETQELAGGAGLHVTVAHWLLPDGANLNGKGVEPTVSIEPSSDKSSEKDVQLEKAGEILLSYFSDY